LLALVSILLILEAERRTPRMNGFMLCLAGICLGLGTWNHFIFLSVPLGLLAIFVDQKRLKLLLDPKFYVVVGGILLVLSPRIYRALNGTGHLSSQPGGLHALFQRFIEWPAILAGVVDGNIIFQRYSGEVLWRFPGIMWLVLLLGAVLHFRRAGWSWNPRTKQAAIFTAVLYCATVVMCPYNSDRYFLLVFYAIPLFVALAFRELFLTRHLRQLWPIVLLVLSALELARTADNYFAAQQATHGRISTFSLGRDTDTSNHLIRTDDLYNRLLAMHAREIYAEYFIAEPLQFYDLANKQFHSVHVTDSAAQVPQQFEDPDETFVVVYNDGGKRRLIENDLATMKQIARDEHFIILTPAKNF
jgi:hypothetical protein